MNTSKAFLTKGMKRANLCLRKASLMLVFKIYFQRESNRRENIQEAMVKVRARGKLDLIPSSVSRADEIEHQDPCQL